MDKILQPIVAKYGNLLIEKLKAAYNQANLKATGEYENTLELQLNNTSFIVNQAVYAQFIDNGRAPGNRPPIPSIMRWLENKKGLPPSMLKDKRRTAFAIATKIAKDGIKVPNQYNPGQVLSTVVNNFLVTDVYNMLTEIETATKQQLEYEMMAVFKSA